MRRLLSVLALSTVSLFASVASAATITQTYYFTFFNDKSNTTFSGQVTFTGATDPSSGNSAYFDITNATGTINGAALSLAPLQPGTPTVANPILDQTNLFYTDNAFNPASFVKFTSNGVLLTNGTINFSFEGAGPNNVVYESTVASPHYLDGNPVLTLSTTPFLSATPEPGSIALCGTGLLAVAGAVRRKRLA